MTEISSYTDREDSVKFRARTTIRQIESFTQIIENRNHHEIDLKLKSFTKRKLDLRRIDQCRSWASNSRNTQKVIGLSQNLFKDDTNFFGLQWVFPQVYYAIFCSFRAMSIAMGSALNENHKGVLNEIGSKMKRNHYPSHLNLYCEGAKQQLSYSNSISCQFAHAREGLRTTHEQLLQDKKEAYHKQRISEVPEKFHSSKGEVLRRFSNEKWCELGKSLVPTTLVHYLYRKRIMSNYSGAYVFDYEGPGAMELYLNLALIANEYIGWQLAVASKCVGDEV